MEKFKIFVFLRDSEGLFVKIIDKELSRSEAFKAAAYAVRETKDSENVQGSIYEIDTPVGKTFCVGKDNDTENYDIIASALPLEIANKTKKTIELAQKVQVKDADASSDIISDLLSNLKPFLTPLTKKRYLMEVL